MPRTIFNARVNQTFAAPTDTVKPYDKIAQVTYDLDGITPVGVYGDALPGMTCFVGTTGTGTGLYDVGIVRIRKGATSSVLYFGEESEIEWTDNLILTVIDSMELWPKHVRVAAGVTYVDYDVAYTNQNTVFDPVPIMSADAVAELDLTELVSNGTFATTTSGWTAGTGVLLTVVANTMKIDRNGAATIDHAYQDVTTVVGKKYKAVVNIVSYSHQYEVYVGGTLLFDYAQGTGTKTYYFTATATTTRIAFRATNNSAATLNVDDVSFQRVETVVFDATDSWVFGSTISTYAWTTTAGSLSSSSVANPTLTIIAYPTGGKIRVALTVTSAAGKTATGYRYIHVYNSANPPQSSFRLNSCDGFYDDGGYSFSVTMFASAGITTIRDRAPMILFAQDHYGTAIADQTSLGQLEDRENIVAMGWINGESIEWSADRSAVTFTVEGPQFWLRKMTGFPPILKNSNSGAANWERIPSLTVDRAIWHLLHWCSTATAVMDFYKTGDTRLENAFDIPPQSLWDQMNEIAYSRIFARPCCDQYNRLFVEVDLNMVPEADRTTIPVVMEITSADRKNLIRATRATVDEVCLVDLSGTVVQSPGKSATLYSLSPGHVYGRYGFLEIVDRLILSSQTQSNQLAGLLFGKRNNPYPEWNIDLAQNNRMIGICPRQYVSITVAAGDTVRGFAYTGNLIPRSISYEHNENTGFTSPSMTFEAETFEQIAITGDAPGDSSIPPDDGGTDPPVDIPPIEDGEVPLEGPAELIVFTADAGVMYTINADEADPADIQWFFMNSGFGTTTVGASTYEDKNHVVWIGETPSGKLFAMCSPYTAPAPSNWSVALYWAPGLGGVWTELFRIDATDYTKVSGVGINPTVNEQIAVTTTGPVHQTLYSELHFWLGDSSGLVDSGQTDLFKATHNGVHFNLGEWAFVYNDASGIGGSLSDRNYGRFTAAGVFVAKNSITTDPFATNAPLYGLCAGGYIYTYQYNVLHVTNDNFVTETVPAGTPAFIGTGSDQGFSGLCVSPDGQYLMGGDGNTIGQRSSDFGATWGNVGTGGTGGMTVGFWRWANGGDSNWWFSATTQKVIRTADFGDTWYDRTGNLSTLAPLCDIRGLLVMRIPNA